MDKPYQWTKKELVAYILLYVANSDLQQTSEEKDFIISRVNKDVFESVYKEFERDNDYQCIQKIIKGVKAHDYFRDDFAGLFADIKQLLYVDGEVHAMEKATILFLKKMLKQ